MPEVSKSSSSSSGSSSSSDSSSSCSSSSSSSSDDDEGSNIKRAHPAVRTRDLDPVPQKKAQIVMAKQEPPKKRSRKPLPLETQEFLQSKGPRKILKTSKDTDLPGAIKKPVHPASFTFMGFHRNSAKDAAGGQNRGLVSQGGAVGSGRSVQPASLALNKSSQNRNAAEGKLSISNASSGTSLDLKAAASKSKGVAALNLNTSKNPIQGTTQHTLSPPNGQKKPQAPVSTLQRLASTKAPASLPPKNASSNHGLGLQPLNLQNKSVQSSNAPGNGTTPLSSGAKKTPVTQNQEYSPKSPSILGKPQVKKNQAGTEKIKGATEIQTSRVQGRQEKKSEVQSQEERLAPKDGKKSKMNDMSTGEEESGSDSDQDSSCAEQDGSVATQNQDWKPTRSLIEHVFVTDVTANLVTVTVKESPTSVGFFSIRNY